MENELIQEKETEINEENNRPENTLENPQRAKFVILATALVISICGISYELLCATISSYFLGNAVLQYSLTIGIFLFAMGIGSWLSSKFEKNLVFNFLVIEIIIGFIGGYSTLILFTAYRFTEGFSIIMYGLLLVLGTLIGFEVPILIRLLKNYDAVKFSVAGVLTFDYIGALLASIIFPLVVLPHLGMMHASFFYAILNMVIVFFNISIFKEKMEKVPLLTFATFFVTLLLFLGLGFSTSLVSFFESKLYDDEIILSRQTKYQRIVMTRYKDDLRLFLDGNLQFSSWDEYRFHECEVIPAMELAQNREEVLILGGGDGLAAREVLKYEDVKQITLVDIDREMVEICKTDPMISKLNNNSLSHPRTNIVIDDAFRFIENIDKRYGVIIVDLPDPNNESLSKLYSRYFYITLKKHLGTGGVICVQSTSPLFARETFWCIVHTIEDAGKPRSMGEKELHVYPMHAYVPSMGEWGFTLACDQAITTDKIKISVPTKFLTPQTFKALFAFSKDSDEVETRINTLNNHILLEYYNKEWERWE
ncbi:MAG: polyamine aminopropyltransferase [Vulcanimicrobiota bacterium]